LCDDVRRHAFDHGFFRVFVVRGFLLLVKRSYVQQSSPGQTEGLKVVAEWVGFEFARVGERENKGGV
jgi:hypothetical protein